MRKFRQGLLEAAERYEGVKAEPGKHGRHPTIDLHYQGRRRFVVIPNTPSDGRSFNNTVRDIRRELRNLGVAA